MRAALGRRVAFKTNRVAQSVRNRWLQVGFTSFAYRLAHLFLPRPLVILSVSALFYLA